ncbi:unnamed protein product [Lactuca virosa]|uniref:Zer-1-like leucine-rich repeats region domain-containing protein n=1 Tax=Lactuca virosa TaxID=75947 RepID=A0AAU9PG03_9ASTR|nr:unnamed protein product [Lactuca virosa]
MSYGNLKRFEPPKVLNSLKILNLKECYELVSIHNLSRLPNLESLILWNCSSLTHVCESIGGLKSLALLDFTGCKYLMKTLKRLREFVYRGCNKVSEIQGLFKLVPIAKHDEADLGHMKWIKAYQDYRVYLVGDEITKERDLRIQVLYEYGIMSTYLPGIRDESMPMPDYMSLIPFLSFRVPSTEKHRIRGLNVTCLYRLSGEDEDMWVLFIKISNITNGLNWMYNPMVYCQPRFYEDAVWLSYWPIGNILDTGDEINVSIVGNGLMVSECSASFVYIDDGELELENCKSYTKEEEVIGGDLSGFELTIGAYYLCRRDYFKITTPDWLKVLLGDTIHYKKYTLYRRHYYRRQGALATTLYIVAAKALCRQ